MTTMPFYFATIEQYYTGELNLPIINGVDDGSLGYIAVGFISAVYGCSWWKTQYSFFGFPPLQRGHFLLFLLLIFLAKATFDKYTHHSSLITYMYSMMNIYKKRNSKHFALVYNPALLVCNVLWYFINAGIFFAAAYFSPSNIMTTHPRRVMYAFGFQFILLTLRVQLSHVIQAKFCPFRRTHMLTWSILLLHLVSVFLFQRSFMDEAIMYLVIDLVSLGSIMHFVVNVIGELSTILDINILTMTAKQVENAKKIALVTAQKKDH